MTIEWCKQKNKENATKKENGKEEFLRKIEYTEYLNKKEKEEIFKCFEEDPKDYRIECILNFASHKYFFDKNEEKFNKCGEWAYNVAIPLLNIAKSDFDYFYFKDSEPKEFDGDIIITDPCYFIRSEEEDYDYYKLESIGIPSSISRDTIYGDWSCAVVDENKNKLGEFCADSGMVCVADLKEVLNHNPKFAEKIQDSPWICTIVRNFKGTVQFVVADEEYEYEGEKRIWYNVKVVGNGVNKITGETINFSSLQTGF